MFIAGLNCEDFLSCPSYQLNTTNVIITLVMMIIAVQIIRCNNTEVVIMMIMIIKEYHRNQKLEKMKDGACFETHLQMIIIGLLIGGNKQFHRRSLLQVSSWRYIVRVFNQYMICSRLLKLGRFVERAL